MASATSSTPFPLGAYLGNPNGNSASGEAAFESSYDSFVATMGAAPQFLDNYVDYTQPVSEWVSNASWQAWSDAQSADAKGLTPVIGLPMASIASGAPSADAQYQAIAAGNYDSVYAGIVQAYAAQGYTSLVFRPGWEMNITGPTYAGDTAQDQADWVAAFQHIYTVLHQAAAAAGVDVSVVWNPDTTSWGTADPLTALYPGNAYVDAIGADAYADAWPETDGTNSSGQTLYHDWDTGQEDTSLAQFLADPVNREHDWTYPAANRWQNDGSSGHALSLDQIIQFAEQQGEPLAIPETGAGNSGNGSDVSDDAAFPAWLATQLDAAEAAGEKIDFVNIWDSNGGGNYEFSNASDDKPQEAAAWAQYFGAETPAAAVTSSSSVAITTPAPSPTVPATNTTAAIPAATTPGTKSGSIALPAPVNGIVTDDTSSLQLSTLLGQGSTMQFVSGTEAVQLTNGTLSVGVDTNEATLQRFYEGLLGRSGDTGGLANFDQMLADGTSLADVATDFLNSAEYQGLHGSSSTMTDTQFVTSLYQSFLGRAPDQAGIDGWMSALADGTSRGQVAVAFTQSAEAEADMAADTSSVWVPNANGALVTQLYETGLDRVPDLAGLQRWTQMLENGLTPAQLAADIVGSAEFQIDHAGQDATILVTSFYQDGLGRAPDAPGLASWVGQLQSGASQGGVLLGLAASPEAVVHLSPPV